MLCPYCNRDIFGFTGLQEATKFHKHLARCRKNPNNIILRDGRRAAVVPKTNQTFMDALRIRADSGQ